MPRVARILFHDWRRTSARAKRHAGLAEDVIIESQGWKTAGMFRRYAIVNNADKLAALQRVDNFVDNPVETPAQLAHKRNLTR